MQQHSTPFPQCFLALLSRLSEAQKRVFASSPPVFYSYHINLTRNCVLYAAPTRRGSVLPCDFVGYAITRAVAILQYDLLIGGNSPAVYI